MKIIYMFVDYKKFDMFPEDDLFDTSSHKYHYLHLEGREWTVGWNEENKIFLTNRPIVRKEPIAEQALSGPPIEEEKEIDMADAHFLVTVEATTEHPLYQLMIGAYEMLKQKADLETALKSKHEQLETLLKSFPKTISIDTKGSS